MGLDASFFAVSGIDPDAEYSPVAGTTMSQTVAEIRKRFDKAERMNCRDIMDLIECIDRMRVTMEAIRLRGYSGTDWGNSGTHTLAVEGLRISA